MDKKIIEFIEEQIDYKFKNEELLEQAFTRRSYSKENGGQDNEILEFFGDKVLDFCVTKKLSYYYGELIQCGCYSTFGATEKDLTNIRKNLVESSMLAHRIDVLGFASFLKMGKGDKKNAVQNEQHVKEDLFESILGAVAIDCDWRLEDVSRVVDLMLDTSFYLEKGFSDFDYVEEVQKWCQRNQGCLPCYVFKESDMYQINYWLIGGGYTKKKRIHSENKGKYVCILDIGLEYEFAGYGDSQSKSRRETARLVYDYLNENGLLTSIEEEIGEPCIDRAINQLQELSQKGYCEIPEYKFKETHDSNGNPRWVCECCVEDQEYMYSSESSSKKTAKKRAAYFMLLYVLGYDPTEDEEWGGDDE